MQGPSLSRTPVRVSTEGLTKRCSQPLTGVQLYFSMINTRSFQANLAIGSGG